MGCGCGKRFTGRTPGTSVRSGNVPSSSSSNAKVVNSAPQPNIRFGKQSVTRRTV